MTWRAPVRRVVAEVASTGALCGGRCGEHRCTMWWATWQALVHCVVDDVASTGTLYGGSRGEHRYTMWCIRRLLSYATPCDVARMIWRAVRRGAAAAHP